MSDICCMNNAWHAYLCISKALYRVFTSYPNQLTISTKKSSASVNSTRDPPIMTNVEIKVTIANETGGT